MKLNEKGEGARERESERMQVAAANRDGLQVWTESHSSKSSPGGRITDMIRLPPEDWHDRVCSWSRDRVLLSWLFTGRNVSFPSLLRIFLRCCIAPGNPDCAPPANLPRAVVS
jgi:hypothetical protein